MFKKSNYGTLKINKQQTIHKIVNHIHYLSNNESLEAVSVKYNVPVKLFLDIFNKQLHGLNIVLTFIFNLFQKK